MLHIWGRLSSINVRKVVWAAQEVGVAFERTDAGASFGVVNTPQYLQMNPNAMVPVLQDGALTLWESNTIVRYLCARYAPGTLYPEPLAERFNAERWMDWQQTALNPAGRQAFLQLIRTPLELRQPELIRQSNQETESLLTILDAQLGRHAFVAGAQFSMADIPVACELHRWLGLPQVRLQHRHVERWYHTLRERQASQGVLDLVLS
ncbi:MAG: glutathione S-transferase [Rhodoferax sp.]